MEELAYDTLTEAKQLEAAGFDGRQAEAIVGTVSRAAAINEQMAGDLIAIRSRTDAIAARTDAITVQVDAIAARTDAITVQVDAITARTDAITVQVDAIKERIDNEMVTRSDLVNFATKDDLKNFATKDDLKNFATKVDLAELRTEMAEGFGALSTELQKCMKSVYRNMIWVMTVLFSGFAALMTALRIWG